MNESEVVEKVAQMDAVLNVQGLVQAIYEGLRRRSARSDNYDPRINPYMIALVLRKDRRKRILGQLLDCYDQRRLTDSRAL
jgi:hypothetical protein